MKQINIEKYPLFVMMLYSMIDNIALEWDENIWNETNYQVAEKEEKPIIVTQYKGTYTALYLTGEIYEVTMTTKKEGKTWNGDDAYYNAHSEMLTKEKKLGALEINFKANFENDDVVENIAVQYINFLQEL